MYCSCMYQTVQFEILIDLIESHVEVCDWLWKSICIYSVATYWRISLRYWLYYWCHYNKSGLWKIPTQIFRLNLPYGWTKGIAHRTAVSGGEQHDHHFLRGHLNAVLRYPHTNFVVKQNDECGSAFQMSTSFRMLPTSGYVGNSFTITRASTITHERRQFFFHGPSNIKIWGGCIIEELKVRYRPQGSIYCI